MKGTATANRWERAKHVPGLKEAGDWSLEIAEHAGSRGWGRWRESHSGHGGGCRRTEESMDVF